MLSTFSRKEVIVFDDVQVTIVLMPPIRLKEHIFVGLLFLHLNLLTTTAIKINHIEITITKYYLLKQR